MISYFEVTQRDRDYYRQYLAERMPRRVLDVHSHVNLPEHVRAVPAERIAGDCALQSGYQMTCEEARAYAAAMFPRQEYAFVGFPFPIAEADMRANNAYVAQCAQEGGLVAGLMAVRPEWTAEELEPLFASGLYAGIKPYPDFVAKRKGANISIFDFLPKFQLKLAEQYGLCVMLHLPRAERLADENNLRELLEIRRLFPTLRVILAHLGRCYNEYHFLRGMEGLGTEAAHFWYDTAAVMNPKVLTQAFARLPSERLMFGLDLPIFLWHGIRKWGERTYQNFCKEPLPWKPADISPQEAESYPLFVYLQIRNILEALDQNAWDDPMREAFFCHNARRLMGGEGIQ